MALDLLESFRGPVADRLILTLLNRKEFREEDFGAPATDRSIRLKPDAFKRFLAEYEKWMLGKPAAGEESGFRKLLRHESERMAAAVRESTSFEPYRFGAKEAPCST